MRLFSHRLVLAGLAVVGLVASSSCGSSSSPMGPAATPADVTITIVGMNGNMSFSANPGVVRVGQTVAWSNATGAGYGGVTHHITADNGSFTTGDIPAGATSSPIKMTAAGSIPYHCTIHPMMVGSLTVQ